MEYENVTDRKIIAIELGLVSFDVWDDFLHFMHGLDMEKLSPGNDEDGFWKGYDKKSYSLKLGMAFVNRVRFEDGEIWHADAEKILQELQKVDSSIDIDDIKKKRDK